MKSCFFVRVVWLGIIILPLGTLATPVDVPAQEPRLYLNPLEEVYATGDFVEVQVIIDPNEVPIKGVMCFLHFDQKKLVFQQDKSSINHQVMDYDMITTNPASHENEVISFSSGAENHLTENGTLVATIVFQVVGKTGATEVTFGTTKPRFTELIDEVFDHIPAELVNATISIRGDKSPAPVAARQFQHSRRRCAPRYICTFFNCLHGRRMCGKTR